MAHTHEYDCIVCGAHFESSRDLANHNEHEHLANAQGMEHPRTKEPIKPAYDMRDRNPRQGDLDPGNDSSKAT